MAVASMVLGIIGLVFPFIGLYPIGFVCAIVGLILGILAKKKEPSGKATAGIVMSIISLALCTIVTIACVACASAVSNAINENSGEIVNGIMNNLPQTID